MLEPPQPSEDLMNRRTHNRTKVDLLINRFLDGHPYMCRMTDISSTGLRLVPLLEPKGVPRFMGLQFQLPGEETVLIASGEAINENGSDGQTSTGVRFTTLAPEFESVIRRFVESN
jgi:PilZ domain